MKTTENGITAAMVNNNRENMNAANSARVNNGLIMDGPYRFDWKTGEMVKIKGTLLEIGQKVFFNAAYNDVNGWFVCTSEPTGGKYPTQKIVEIDGRHRSMSWDVQTHDRSTEQIFGIGLYFDPSGERLTADEIRRHEHRADVQTAWNERRERNKQAADEKERAELRKQWAGVLVPLEDVKDWKEREKQEKNNVINYMKYHFEGVKFSARKSSGGGLCVKWQDGPAVDKVEELLHIWHDHHFNGYEDYNEYCPTNFNRLFGGYEWRLDTERSYSHTRIEEARRELLNICPEFTDIIGTGKAYKLEAPDYCAASQMWLDMTVNRHRDNETARAFEKAGEDMAREWQQINPDSVINNYLDAQSFEAEPKKPTAPTTPKGGKKTATATETTGNEAPAAGLHLEEIAGGVAVIGNDWKDTYFNKRQIKANGAHWNKEAKQWEATDPADVSRLRAWFALRDGEQTTAPATLQDGGEITEPKPTEGTAQYYADQLTANANEEKPLFFRFGSREIMLKYKGYFWDMSNPDGIGTQKDLTTEEAADVLAEFYKDTTTPAAEVTDCTPLENNGAPLTEWEKRYPAPQEWIRPGVVFCRHMNDGRDLYAIITRLGKDCFFYVIEKCITSRDHLAAYKDFNFDGITAPATIDKTAPRFAKMLAAYEKNRREFVDVIAPRWLEEDDKERAELAEKKPSRMKSAADLYAQWNRIFDALALADWDAERHEYRGQYNRREAHATALLRLYLDNINRHFGKEGENLSNTEHAEKLPRDIYAARPACFTDSAFYEAEATDENGHRIKTANEIKEQARRLECNYMAGRGGLREAARRLERTNGADHPDTLKAYKRLQSRAADLYAAEMEAHRQAGEKRRRAFWAGMMAQAMQTVADFKPATLENPQEITDPNERKEALYIDFTNTRAGVSCSLILNWYSIYYYVQYITADREAGEKAADWATNQGQPGQIKEGNGWRIEIKAYQKAA